MVTPLAGRILKEITRPIRERTIEDKNNILNKMYDIHCFEISSVLYECDSVMSMIGKNCGLHPDLAFLPFPKTWIEWKNPNGHRIGYLLDGTQDDKNPVCISAGDALGLHSLDEPFRLLLNDHFEHNYPKGTDFYGATIKILEESNWTSPGILEGALALINSPKIIGMRTHLPHENLQKRLIKSGQPVGQFPLNAWTEIIIKTSGFRDASDDDPVQGNLTGMRAHHWVRAHTRIRYGRLEFVPHHERGNKLFGSKQSRYTITP